MDGTRAQTLASPDQPKSLAAWPQRAWALGLIGAIGGVAIHWLLDGGSSNDALRQAAASFLIVGLLAFGHMWVQGHLARAMVVGAVAGAVIALVFLWNGTPTGQWSSGQSWRVVAALVAAAVFVPLAQAAGDQTAVGQGAVGQGASMSRGWSVRAVRNGIHRHFPYPAMHGHAWTNMLTTGLSVLFAGAFFLMLLLMGELFNLIGIRVLREWLGEGWVVATIWGGAIGTSTGLLLDRGGVIASLQAVVMVVMRVAAPVLAVSLALFLAILPLTGLAPLWDATRATTPILLSAVIVALLLANSVIGDGGEDEARSPVLRLAALVLVVVVTPLAVIAAVSTGLRVGQYGWTPERLWAATFVGMACVVALGCLLAVMQGRRDWATAMRGANLWLALLICGVALLLSTPLLRFDGIATRNQVARLADGRTRADAFDYSALWFDFGPEGRTAIRGLAASGATASIREQARAVQVRASKWAPDPMTQERQSGNALDARVTILPTTTILPPELRKALIGYDVCAVSGPCVVHYRAGEDVAVIAHDRTADCKTCAPNVAVLVRNGKAWVQANSLIEPSTSDDAISRARAGAIGRGKVDMRIESYRRVYIDGMPFAAPIPMAKPTQNGATRNEAP